MGIGDLLFELYNLVISMLSNIQSFIDFLITQYTFGGIKILDWELIAPFVFKPIELATVGLLGLFVLWIIKDTVPVA